MITDLPQIGQVAKNRASGMQAMLYKHDQLHRIVASKSLTSYTAANGFAERTSPNGAYDENYSYDGNGNILTLYRLDSKAAVRDDFHYSYYDKSNRLKEINPLSRDTAYHSGAIPYTRKLYNKINVDGSAYAAPGKFVELLATDSIIFDADFSAPLGSDFLAQLKPGLGTYIYDAIGNLVRDYEQGVKIEWTPYGKIRKVHSRNDSVVVTFRYDGSGNRVEKNVVKPDTSYVTRYVRDAGGNVMSIYNDTLVTEQPIYGNGRIGMYFGGVTRAHRTLGKRKYELANHLGNVLAVITDNLRISSDSTWASVASVTDYYPFGLAMDGRHLTAVKDTTSSGTPVKAPIPLAQYTFNGNAQDMTAHGYNGTVTGAVLTTDNRGNAGNAYHFDGVNDVIRLANTKDSLAFIQNTAVFTITAFIKLDDVNARSVFVCSANTATAKGFTFMYENYDATYGLHQLRFSITTGVSGQTLTAKGAQNAIHDTNWHHVAVIGNGTSVRFYVDGVADGATTPVKYLSTGASTKDVVIGAIPNPTTTAIALPYKGAIDEVNIFNTALSVDEIKNLAQRMPMSGAQVASSDTYVNEDGYRYGFNGKEKDPATELGNATYDYGFRIYNARLGKFLSVDPLTANYAYYTPYQFAGNKPIMFIDLDGAEFQIPLFEKYKYGHDPITDVVTVVDNVWVNTVNGAIQLVNSGIYVVHGVATNPTGVPAQMKAETKAIASATTEYFVNLKAYATQTPVKQQLTDLGNGLMNPESYEGSAEIAIDFLLTKRVSPNSLMNDATKTARVASKVLPCGCFDAATRVLTDSGYVEIKDIKVGDFVWAYNENNAKKELKEVTHIIQYTRDTLFLINIGRELIKATSDHPFYIGRKWIKVRNLHVGDSVTSDTGHRAPITKIEFVREKYTVYNFTVDEFHTYFISNQNILVHNGGPCDILENSGLGLISATRENGKYKLWLANGIKNLEAARDYLIKEYGAVLNPNKDKALPGKEYAAPKYYMGKKDGYNIEIEYAPFGHGKSEPTHIKYTLKDQTGKIVFQNKVFMTKNSGEIWKLDKN